MIGTAGTTWCRSTRNDGRRVGAMRVMSRRPLRNLELSGFTPAFRRGKIPSLRTSLAFAADFFAAKAFLFQFACITF